MKKHLKMSPRSVSLWTLLPMLLHSSLGCCWHHGHPLMQGVGMPPAMMQSSEEFPSQQLARCCGLPHRTTKKLPSQQSLPESSSSSTSDSPEGPQAPCEEGRCEIVGVCLLRFSDVGRWLPSQGHWQLVTSRELADARRHLAGPAAEHVADLPLSQRRERRALLQIWLI